MSATSLVCTVYMPCIGLLHGNECDISNMYNLYAFSILDAHGVVNGSGQWGSLEMDLLAHVVFFFIWPIVCNHQQFLRRWRQLIIVPFAICLLFELVVLYTVLPVSRFFLTICC